MKGSNEDSLQLNVSGDFVFDLTKDKINPHHSIRNDTFDDLEYSIDDNGSVLADLHNDKEFNAQRVIPNISAPVTIFKEEDKKRERKAIFEKYKNKNELGQRKDVMDLFDEVLRGKNPQVQGVTATYSDPRRKELIDTRRVEQVETVPNNPPGMGKMAPPPGMQMLKKNSSHQSPRQVQTHPAGKIQHHDSNLSAGGGGSFFLDDKISLIYGSGHNPFGDSRESQQIKEMLGENIFESVRPEDRGSLQIDNRVEEGNLDHLLDDIRISAIGNQYSLQNVEEDGVLSGIKLVNSQDINTLRKQLEQPQPQPASQPQHQPPAQVQPKPQPPSEPQPQPQPQSQPQPQPSINQLQHQNNPLPMAFPATQAVNQIPPQIDISDLQSQESNSQLSINSHFLKNKNPNNNSSAMFSSNSLSKALEQLNPHTFLQASPESRMPDLLKECWRLNSISVNVHCKTFALDSLMHKQILRSLVFEELMAAETLQRFREELVEREAKQKTLRSSFKVETFLEGAWHSVHKVKNNECLKPHQPHPKRPIDFNHIKETLRNSLEVLKYFQNFIQHFKIQQSEEFKKKYVELRNSLFDIFNNLKKISEDLYMKSITHHLPEHYHRLYDYWKTASVAAGNPTNELRKMIQDRENILVLIQYFRNEHDPLCCTDLAKQIEAKAKSEVSLLKANYFNKNAKNQAKV